MAAHMGRFGDTGVVTFSRAYPVKEANRYTGAVDAVLYIETVFGYLDYVNVCFSEIPTTSEDLVVEVEPVDGDDFAMMLMRVNPAVAGVQNVFYQPHAPILLEYGDNVRVTYQNSDGNDVFVKIMGHSTVRDVRW